MIDLENISFDHCIKCTVCTVYCPVARATPDYPGPKASGPDAERLRIKDPLLVDASLKLCTNCKRCEIACPSDVKIADIIGRARARYVRKHVFPRDFFMAHTDLAGTLATRVAPVANRAVGLAITRRIMDTFMGFPGERVFPEYARGTFHSWFKRHAPPQARFEKKLVYFTGCYVNYNFHQLGKDVLKVANAMGHGVVLAREKCCGVPLIANGYLDGARANARYNVRSLSRTSKDGALPVVSASSSCTFALASEYPHLLEVDNAKIAPRTFYVTRFLSGCFERGEAPRLKKTPLRVAYHAPCHLERMGGAPFTIDILKKIPGLEITVLNPECCGISGTYGFKKEFYEISQEVGRRLFEQIGRTDPDFVVTDCETCKWQIEMSTPYKVLHPVSLLALALGNERKQP